LERDKGGRDCRQNRRGSEKICGAKVKCGKKRERPKGKKVVTLTGPRVNPLTDTPCSWGGTVNGYILWNAKKAKKGDTNKIRLVIFGGRGFGGPEGGKVGQ